MSKDIFSIISEDKILSIYPGIKYVIDKAMKNKVFLLFFVSPEIILKATIIKDFMNNNINYLSEKEALTLKLLSLNISSKEILLRMREPFNETNLIYSFIYYAKNGDLPKEVVNNLVESLNYKSTLSREYFYINILLSYNFLQHRNFSLLEKHIKGCLDYINLSLTIDDYEIMLTYLLFAKYLENKNDIFLCSAENFYNLAERLCIGLKDNITLSYILITSSFYFNNIGDIKMALSYAQKAIKVTKSLELKFLNYRLCYTLGTIYLKIGDYNKASKYINDAVYISYALDDFPSLETARLLNTLGYVYHVNNNNEEAINCHLKAIKELSSSNSISCIIAEAQKNLSQSVSLLYYAW